jgi:hypothetical protein
VFASGLAASGWDRVTSSSPVGGDESGVRERLTDRGEISNQSRPAYWRVARAAFADDPVAGTGAGTFGLVWARERPSVENATEGHSLYFETLAELGVVGAVLLLAVLIPLVGVFFTRLRGPTRPLYAAFSAVALTWLFHAALDWDWELPVLSIWLFAAGGTALAASERVIRRNPPRRRWLRRALTAGACAVVALTPLFVAISQQRLDTAVAAFAKKDCDTAVASGEGATSLVPARPEGYAIRGYCAVLDGRPARGIGLMESAVERDPENWEYHYGLAIVRATAGADPRDAARRANELNPRENRTQEAVRRLVGTNPRVWRKRALRQQLPVVRRGRPGEAQRGR